MPYDIVSDLHMGREPLDVFGPGGAALFTSFLASRPDGTTLVVAGDAWDFLTVPGGGLHAAYAAAKAAELRRARGDVVAALVAFAARPGNRLAWLPGNHDPEVLLPVAWRELWDGEPPCTPRASYEFEAGGRRFLVRHGDSADPWNAVDYASVGPGLAYPKGSRLVDEAINPAARELPWVKLVQPEVPAVPVLVAAFRPWVAMRSLAPAARYEVAKLVDEYTAGHLSAGPGWATKLAARALSLLPSPSEDGPDAYAEEALGLPYDVVVFGHTHRPKAEARGKRLYVNAGCWQPRLTLPGPSGLEAWVASLAEGTYEVERRPTFVHVGDEGKVSLCAWDGVSAHDEWSEP